MEDKIEKILREVFNVQKSINSKGNKNDINEAIASIRKEIGSNPEKILSN